MVAEINIHCWVKANSAKLSKTWEHENLIHRFSLFAHVVDQFDNLILSSWLQSAAGRHKVIYSEWERAKENMHRYTQIDKAARSNGHRDASQWKMALFLFSRTFLSVFCVASFGRVTIFFPSVRFLPWITRVTKAFFIFCRRHLDLEMFETTINISVRSTALCRTQKRVRKCFYTSGRSAPSSPRSCIKSVIEPEISGWAALMPGAY